MVSRLGENLPQYHILQLLLPTHLLVRSFSALGTAHLFSFNQGTDVIGTCGKAVCQSIDFSSVNFLPQRPHTYSTAIMWGCYACGNVHVTAEGGSSSIVGTDNAPQQLRARPFYCSSSMYCLLLLMLMLSSESSVLQLFSPIFYFV